MGQAWRQDAASFATDDISKAYDEARRAADKAVSLAPDLLDVRMAVGLLAMTPGLDFPAAEKEFRRVLESSPNNAAAKISPPFHSWLKVDLPKPRKLVGRRFGWTLSLRILWYNLGRITAGTAVTRKPRKRFAKDLSFSQMLRVFILPRHAGCLQNRPAQATANAQLENGGFWRDYAVALVQQAQRPIGGRRRLKDFIARDSTAAHFRSLCSTQFERSPTRCLSGSTPPMPRTTPVSCNWPSHLSSSLIATTRV